MCGTCAAAGQAMLCYPPWCGQGVAVCGGAQGPGGVSVAHLVC